MSQKLSSVIRSRLKAIREMLARNRLTRHYATYHPYNNGMHKAGWNGYLTFMGVVIGFVKRAEDGSDADTLFAW